MNKALWIVFFVAVLFVLAGPAWTAETFKLNTPQAEEAIFCFTKQSAIDVANEGDNSVVAFLKHVKAGNCIMAMAVVSYSRKVHENGTFRVYEGTIGTTRIFNPTSYKAIGEHGV